jgi:hypothetical protein
VGGLIPNPHDDSVKQKLDKQFSDPHLRNLRDRIDKGNPPTEPFFFFDPNNPRHLARIAYRLKIWPEPNPQAGEPPPTTTQSPLAISAASPAYRPDRRCSERIDSGRPHSQRLASFCGHR